MSGESARALARADAARAHRLRELDHDARVVLLSLGHQRQRVAHEQACAEGHKGCAREPEAQARASRGHAPSANGPSDTPGTRSSATMLVQRAGAPRHAEKRRRYK